MIPGHLHLPQLRVCDLGTSSFAEGVKGAQPQS